MSMTHRFPHEGTPRRCYGCLVHHAIHEIFFWLQEVEAATNPDDGSEMHDCWNHAMGLVEGLIIGAYALGVPEALLADWLSDLPEGLHASLIAEAKRRVGETVGPDDAAPDVVEEDA